MAASLELSGGALLRAHGRLPSSGGPVRPCQRRQAASASGSSGGAAQTPRIDDASQGQGRAPATPSFKSAAGHPPHRPPLRGTCGTASPWQPLRCPVSRYWTAEAQSVPELVTAQVNAVLRGLSFLTIVLCATDCFLKLEKPTPVFQTFSHHSWAQDARESDLSPPGKRLTIHCKEPIPTLIYWHQPWNHFNVWRLRF